MKSNVAPFPDNITRGLLFRRRFCLGILSVALVALAGVPMSRLLGNGGWTVVKVVFFGLYLLLMAQVAFSSLVAVVGWWILRRGPDPWCINRTAVGLDPGRTLPATAVAMPIHNEDVTRVFAGLRTMYESLGRTAQGQAFDFFILSDTTDSNCWVSEEKAWFELCKQVQGFGRIFYRKRRVQLHHKSGNIADFCRRWGANYRYMIVLDADSVMTGRALVRLVDLMEANPKAGIIQSSPHPVLGRTLYQRIEQFAAEVYRPVFTAGANFWQLRDSTYWGHNAIIRLRPFMKHCAMPELPEVGPLGRRILSHDTIEAALMRRGGYEVWQAHDLEGSYEEAPPNLLSGLQRDRRWCHGNLQHLWFLFERDLKMVTRYNILNGILAYANSPLWLFSMVLGVMAESQTAGGAPGTKPAVVSAVLYAGVLLLLLLPKILGTNLLMRSPRKLKQCGGTRAVLTGAMFETIYSMLLAPILMIFYTRFVLASLCGFPASWGKQVRSSENGPSWGAWFKVLWVNAAGTLVAAAWVCWLAPSLLAWLAPVIAGPILAIFLAKATGSAELGDAARALGLFATPEESEPPDELRDVEEATAVPINPFFAAPQYAKDYGLLQAVLDPYINAIHVSLLRQRTDVPVRTREYMALLADKLLLDGPFVLTLTEKRALLWDAEEMLAMHEKLWSSPPTHLHEWWQAAFRHYVESSALSVRRTIYV